MLHVRSLIKRLKGSTELVKLVLWGAEIKFTLPLDSSYVLPSLRELSLCKVSDTISATAMFTPRVLPTLKYIAMIDSDLSEELGGDDILPQLPLDTCIVTSDEVRSSLGQRGNEMTVYSDRFYAFTDSSRIGRRPPYPRHLYMNDTDGRYFEEFFFFIQDIGSVAEGFLETIYSPENFREAEEDTKVMEIWCEKRGIRLLFEPDFAYVHVSHVLESFETLYEQKKRESDRERAREREGATDGHA